MHQHDDGRLGSHNHHSPGRFVRPPRTVPQLFNSKTKSVLVDDSEVYAEGARVVCLTRKTREVEEMDPEGQPTGNKVQTPMGTSHCF